MPIKRWVFVVIAGTGSVELPDLEKCDATGVDGCKDAGTKTLITYSFRKLMIKEAYL